MGNSLVEILAKSKTVLDKVNSGNYEKGNVDLPLDEVGGDGYVMENTTPQTSTPTFKKYKNIETTKLPQAILDAMIETPIDIPETSFGFDLNEDAIKKINPSISRSQPKQNNDTASRASNILKKSVIMESSSGANEDTIRRIVKEEIEKSIWDYFDKRVISEEIQVKVGNTIFSGNLKPLPKKK